MVAGIAWGSFALGAVRPWGYWPLTVAAVVIAATAFIAPRVRSGARHDLTLLSTALILFLAAIAVQLIPVSDVTLRKLSPEAPQIIVQLDPRVRAGLIRA